MKLSLAPLLAFAITFLVIQPFKLFTISACNSIAGAGKPLICQQVGVGK
jgi:hypothetical protein